MNKNIVYGLLALILVVGVVGLVWTPTQQTTALGGEGDTNLTNLDLSGELNFDSGTDGLTGLICGETTTDWDPAALFGNGTYASSTATTTLTVTGATINQDHFCIATSNASGTSGATISCNFSSDGVALLKLNVASDKNFGGLAVKACQVDTQ